MFFRVSVSKRMQRRPAATDTGSKPAAATGFQYNIEEAEATPLAMANDLRIYTRTVGVLGACTNVDDTVRHRTLRTNGPEWRRHALHDLVTKLPRQPNECEVWVEADGCLRVRLYKTRVRSYAVWQLVVSLILIIFVIVLIVWR